MRKWGDIRRWVDVWRQCIPYISLIFSIKLQLVILVSKAKLRVKRQISQHLKTKKSLKYKPELK